jgi:hypothetical protein
MANQKWVLGGLTFDISPDKDTGWNVEEVTAEHHPIGANSTILQSSGFKSATRSASGHTKSASVKAALTNLQLARNNITLADHRGATSTVRIVALEFDEVLDVTNLGVGTFSFNIKLMKR